MSRHQPKFPLYADTHIWSQRFPAWNQYEVRRPRLPNAIDTSEQWVDLQDNIPTDFAGFIGEHNNECLQALALLKDGFQDSKAFPNLLMIVGPSGSGKSSIGQAFMFELCSWLSLNNPEKRKKFYLWINIKKFTHDFSVLWQLLTKFVTTDLDKMVRVNFRIIVLDGADLIPPSAQQGLKRFLEEHLNGLKAVLICTDSNKIISNIQSRGVAVRTKHISEKDALLVMLCILNRACIGYDRFGLQAVFAEFSPHYSTSKILDFLQELFKEYHFISLENVHRKLGRVVKPSVSVLEVLEPLERCDICTLIPPCKHYDQGILLENSRLRRKELPRYKGGMTCPEFKR